MLYREEMKLADANCSRRNRTVLSRVVNCIRRILPMFGLIFFGWYTGISQTIPIALCNAIEGAVFQQFGEIKVNRNDKYSSDCRFHFDLKDRDRLLVSIERYSSTTISRREIKSDSNYFLAFNNLGETPKFTRVRLKTGRAWDKVFAYRSNARDNFILIRKDEYVITLISTRFEALSDFEMKLRDIDFGTK